MTLDVQVNNNNNKNQLHAHQILIKIVHVLKDREKEKQRRDVENIMEIITRTIACCMHTIHISNEQQWNYILQISRPFESFYACTAPLLHSWWQYVMRIYEKKKNIALRQSECKLSEKCARRNGSTGTNSGRTHRSNYEWNEKFNDLCVFDIY